MVTYRYTHLFRIDIIASYRECNEHQTKNKNNKFPERDTGENTDYHKYGMYRNPSSHHHRAVIGINPAAQKRVSDEHGDDCTFYVPKGDHREHKKEQKQLGTDEEPQFLIFTDRNLPTCQYKRRAYN
jgi:hypothetical protein